jgi:hypothetical protein
MSGIITANPGGDVIRSVAVDPHSKRVAVTSEYVPPHVSYECLNYRVIVIRRSRSSTSRIQKRLCYWRAIRGA